MQGTKNVINFRYQRFKHNLLKILNRIKDYFKYKIFRKDNTARSPKIHDKKRKHKGRN